LELVDRKAVLGAISLGMTVTQMERAIMAIPEVAAAPLIELILAKARIRELEEEAWQEDRSAIQGTNPRLAELIKERQEAIAAESTRLEALTREDQAKIVETANFAAMKERISEEDRLRIVDAWIRGAGI
jgi:hypothetical protein